MRKRCRKDRSNLPHVSAKHSYGFGRAQLVAALVNGLFMLAVVTAIIMQAVSRFANPIVVHDKAVTVAASLGLLLDQFVARMLSHVRRDLNVRELEAETIKQSSLRAWKVIHLKLKRR